ncbi:MAG TPA: dTDP-4-dehydrorhamnose 3,5-epimerase [Dehalococcoidia bacterium]|nr:dTDP-4-dehydrorhamnose 3,5-epimerase [Dehalococcoidia bacterium]
MEHISGVKTRKLRLIPDDRGWLMELLRTDWEEFEEFGQAYVTTCYPGVVKAWHYHKQQTDHFACISGVSKLVLYDPRDDSPTKGMVNELHIGTINPLLVKIPRLVYHGFTAVGTETAMIANFPTALYNYEDPDEYRVPYDDPAVPYKWEVEMG